MKLAVAHVALGESLAATTPREAEGSVAKALEEQTALSSNSRLFRNTSSRPDAVTISLAFS